MPKISIITTTYRHEKFIARAIDSILDQSFVDWELLIGDDSSDNLTWKVIENYTTKYPHKIYAWHHTPNKGIVENMNFLFAKMSLDSEYVAFLEGDDMWTHNYLQKKLDIWAQYPELWLIYNELSIIDEHDTIREVKFIWPRTHKWYKNETNTIWGFLTSDMVCFSYSTLMVRRYSGMQVSDLGFHGLMWSESDFWLQIAKRTHIYGIEESLTLYRKHQDNTSKNPDTSITHFEYFVKKYFSQKYLSDSEYQKMQILILLMRIFVAIGQWRYQQVYRYIISSMKISFSQTFIIGFRSLYYRLIKPLFFRIFDL